MNSPRLWILILVFVSFCAGLAGGLLVVGNMRPEERGPFADYEHMLIDEFDLSAERTQYLHGLLRHYERDIDGFKDAHMDDYMTALGPDLRNLGIQYRSYIRNHLLSADQRPHFDELVQGPPVESQRR